MISKPKSPLSNLLTAVVRGIQHTDFMSLIFKDMPMSFSKRVGVNIASHLFQKIDNKGFALLAEKLKFKGAYTHLKEALRPKPLVPQRLQIALLLFALYIIG